MNVTERLCLVSKLCFYCYRNLRFAVFRIYWKMLTVIHSNCDKILDCNKTIYVPV